MTSAVAGIIDRNGGLRVVVTQRSRMKHHAEPGEQLFIVPGLEVTEPVPWEEIPPLIKRVTKHVAETVPPSKGCGECSMCCIKLYIADEGDGFTKPSNTPCKHCKIGKGCSIYNEKPRACNDFKCLWLASQARNEVMPPWLRPDRCGAIFTVNKDDPTLYECHGTPNEAGWDWIREVQANGYRVKNITFYEGEK